MGPLEEFPMEKNRQHQACYRKRCGIAFLLVFITGFAACGGEASGPIPPGTSEECPTDLCPGGCNSSGQCLANTTQSTTPQGPQAPSQPSIPGERQLYTIYLESVRFDKNLGISAGGVLCMVDARILLWVPALLLPFNWTVYGFMREAVKAGTLSKAIVPFLTSIFGAAIVGYIADDACDPYVTVRVGDKKKQSTTQLDVGYPDLATLLGGKATWKKEPLLVDISLDELSEEGIQAEVFDDDAEMPIGPTLISLGKCLPKSHPQKPQLSPEELDSLQSNKSLTLVLQCSRDDAWTSFLGITAYVTLQIEENK